MVIRVLKRRLLAPFMAILGVLLLTAAHPLSAALPLDFESLAIANIAAWILAITLFVLLTIRASFPRPMTLRFLLVVMIFALSVFPLKRGNSDITAQSLSILGFILLVYGFILWHNTHPVFAAIGRIIQGQRRIPASSFVVMAYTAFLAITLSLSWYCFRFIPGYSDSIAQYVHGKFIASGHLYGQNPLIPRFFPLAMMVGNDGKWYAQYQPLHAILLGFGHLIGAPWLINPMEGALTLVLIYILARRMFDEGTARVAALLTLGCSFMLFMSAEFMNHATSLFFTTLLILCYMETLETLSLNRKTACWWALASGSCLGAIFLTRPLTAIGIGLPFILNALALLRQDFRRYFRPFLFMGAAGMACLMLDLWYNQQTTGAPLLFPSGRYHGSDNISAMGIHGSVSIDAILFKAQNEWSRLNKQLFEWWLPSTFFVMLFCLLPIKNRYVRLLLGIIVSHTIVNFANQFTSGVFGPRYLYETTSALIILSAAGITRIPLLLKTLGIPLPKPLVLQGIITFPILLLFAMSLIGSFPPIVRGYTHFFDNHPDFYFSMLGQSEKPALIFIGREEDPAIKYKWVSFTNPPSDESSVIFALDRGDDKDRSLMQQYPDRHAYVELRGALIPLDNITATP